MTWQTVSRSSEKTEQLAEQLGRCIAAGIVIELVSDVGGGKTTFTRGLARGLGVEGSITSPTFTISKVYSASRGLELHHFDLYRLDDPGIVSMELAESLSSETAVTVIEWADSVRGVLPDNRMSVFIVAQSLNERIITFKYTNKQGVLIDKFKSGLVE